MNTPTINPRNATHFIEAYYDLCGDLSYSIIEPIEMLDECLNDTVFYGFTTHHIFLITKK